VPKGEIKKRGFSRERGRDKRKERGKNSRKDEKKLGQKQCSKEIPPEKPKPG